MRISVSEAKGQLTELVRRAEAGEDVVLTRHGHPTARITAVKQAMKSDDLDRMVEAIQARAVAKANAGESAARSQDFLYDDDGLPG